MKRRSKEDQHPAPTRMNPSLGAARRLMPPGILGAVLPWLIAQAQVDAPPTSSTLGAPPSRLIPDSATNLPVRDLGNGRWQLGQVLIDRSQRTVSFPAVVNMNSAIVEYLAVATGGKTHESILRTDARPFDLHVGMLLLGAKAATTSNPAIFYDPKQKIPGDAIDVQLRWLDGDRERSAPAAEWIFNVESREKMSSGPWAYNGSQVIEGTFVAQREGSVISLISDPYALVNNPRVGHANDEIWRVNTNAVPAVGTEVDVTLRLR